MTTHLKDGERRNKMVTYLVTKPYFDRMKYVVDKDDELENMSTLIRISVEKEVRRRMGEWQWDVFIIV